MQSRGKGPQCDHNGRTCFYAAQKAKYKGECLSCNYGPATLAKRNYMCAVCWAAAIRSECPGETPCIGRNCQALKAQELALRVEPPPGLNEQDEGTGTNMGITDTDKGKGADMGIIHTDKGKGNGTVDTGTDPSNTVNFALAKILDNQQVILGNQDCLMSELQKLKTAVQKLKGSSSSASRGRTLSSSWSLQEPGTDIECHTDKGKGTDIIDTDTGKGKGWKCDECDHWNALYDKQCGNCPRRLSIGRVTEKSIIIDIETIDTHTSAGSTDTGNDQAPAKGTQQEGTG